MQKLKYFGNRYIEKSEGKIHQIKKIKKSIKNIERNRT